MSVKRIIDMIWSDMKLLRYECWNVIPWNEFYLRHIERYTLIGKVYQGKWPAGPEKRKRRKEKKKKT